MKPMLYRFTKIDFDDEENVLYKVINDVYELEQQIDDLNKLKNHCIIKDFKSEYIHNHELIKLSELTDLTVGELMKLLGGEK